MIIIGGALSDPITKLICARFQKLDYPYFLLDTDHYPKECSISLEFDSKGINGKVVYNQTRIDIQSVHAAFVRLTGNINITHLHELVSPNKYLVIAESSLLLSALFNSLDALVANRPIHSLSNYSKPYQQQIIQNHGLAIPKTLLSNEPIRVRDFYFECNEKVIYKSISSVRSIVKQVNQADLSRLELVRNCITQFQELIEGDDVRVHVVGEEIFATLIKSKAIDYRYAHEQNEPVKLRVLQLPCEIKEKCIRLTKSLGLIIAGIDLMITNDGTFYCLEVNPYPAFLYYEFNSGQQISLALANLLISHDHN